jgi:transcription elongation factor Elf1
MAIEEKYIEIPNCPLCGSNHVYKLKVERTHFIKSLTMDDLGEKQAVLITRIFTCPIKNRKFQATIVLYQSPGEKIEQVTVEGIV